MRLSWLLVTGALVGLSACSGKKVEELPPAPPARSDIPAPLPAPPSTPSEQMLAGEVRPGSREDFARTVVADRVRFALDSYELDGQARAILDSQAQWLNRYGAVRLTIEGHADERGTREYNLALGERRANEVRTYLIGQGVAEGRISTISYGKERPEVEGSDEEAWNRNRRAVTIPGEGLTS